jgi:drug/metabolite transporter (DMT)-like permease
MEPKVLNKSVYVAFGMIVLFTGINALAVKSTEAELPPYFGAGLRFGAAAIIIIILMLILRLPLPRGRSFVGAVLFGILGSGISRALLYYALEKLPSGPSMVLLALVPLLTFLFACLHKLENFSFKSLAGSFLAVGGIAVIVQGRINTDMPILPALAVVGAAACFAEATVIIKLFPQSHPITTNAVALTTGSIFLFILSALSGEVPTFPSSITTWESLIYLILIGSVATFILTIYVINHWTASASSYQFVLFPIITIILGVELAHEAMSGGLFIGTSLVLSGVYIGAIAKKGVIKKISTGLSFKRKARAPDC